MSLRQYLSAVALIAPVLMFGSAALAADALDGPPVPGVCLLNQEVVFANSQVGIAAAARLRDLAKAADEPLEAERQSIVTDAKALQAQKPADARTKEQALVQRDNALKISAQKLERQIELTRLKARGQIGEAAQSVVADAFHAHNCGLLINKEVVMGGNMSNDLTAAVIQGLDAKITTITFDLEPYPTPKAASQ